MNDYVTGIVLKRFLPAQQKISVLTQSWGKINLIVKKTDMCQRIWPGMTLSFPLLSRIESSYIIETATIEAMPHVEATPDVWLLYHLLELSYYFLPLEDYCPEAFLIVQECNAYLKHQQKFQYQFVQLKSIFIARFLLTLGSFDYPYFIQKIDWSSFSIDFDDQQKVDSLKIHLAQLPQSFVEELDAWIFCCLKSHPMFKLLKTFHGYAVGVR
jgi:hypothetical protein